MARIRPRSASLTTRNAAALSRAQRRYFFADQRSKRSRVPIETGYPGTWWISDRYGTPVRADSFAEPMPL